ncbi:UBP-type zinc finger domain-containing protein [Mycobacterium sp. ACS1612]|uniref:UBP-type zinc finger domain-containing protein n=1 Tax=Mycobacterium sp. ACS1612 TaxID=1834117 RepID=UPI0009EF63F9|nr:UBP-type zinc finger domain-containing protein [Mycobacterium sp. ACS1612]
MLRRSRRSDTGSTTVPDTCEHLAASAQSPADPEPLTPGKCQDCERLGENTWAHLRMCLTCGHVGCCDSSPHQHASEHFRATGHPVMRSAEPGEDWRWCHIDVRLG